MANVSDKNPKALMTAKTMHQRSKGQFWQLSESKKTWVLWQREGSFLRMVKTLPRKRVLWVIP